MTPFHLSHLAASPPGRRRSPVETPCPPPTIRHPRAADGSDLLPPAPPAPASRARGLLGLAARCLISLAGLLYALHFIHWSDRALVPASALGRDGAAEECVVDASAGDLLEVTDRAGARHRLDLAALAETGVFVDTTPGLRRVLREVDRRLLFAAVLLMAPIYLLQSLRWRALLAAQGARLPVWACFRIHVAACFVGTFLLGILGTDASRTFALAKRGIDRMAALASIAADRAIGMSAMLVVTAALLALSPQGGHDASRLWLLLGALAAATLVYYLPLARRASGASWIVARLSRWDAFARLRDSAGVYRRDHAAVALAAALSLLALATLLLGTALCGRAVGIQAPAGALLFSLTLVWFVGSLPISIMGFGVMEPLGIALLAKGPSSTAGQVVAMLLLARAVLLLHTLPGALALAWPERAPAAPGGAGAAR
jgi:uncharacterized membrane protein YbhN (UPF0104 family)